MNHSYPGFFGLPEETTTPAQAPPTDENPTLSPVRAMYATLLKLRTHVETEKLEQTTLKQLVQRLQKDFPLLQPQTESLDQPPTSKSSLVTLENKLKILEKRLSTEMCRYNSRLNSLQNQLSTMGDHICQFENDNSSFNLWKISSIQPVFESDRSWYLKPGRENAPTTRLRSPIFRSHPYGNNFYLIFYPYGLAAAIGTWASISLSISAGEYDNILPWPVSQTIQIKLRDQLNPPNSWSQTIQSREKTKPTSTEYSTIPTVQYPYFFPHSKLSNDTDGFLQNDTIHIEISFF